MHGVGGHSSVVSTQNGSVENGVIKVCRPHTKPTVKFESWRLRPYLKSTTLASRLVAAKNRRNAA